MRAPCSGRRTPDRSPAAALRARINERQDETREMTRRRGCGCLRGRTSRGSRGFSDRGGAAALRKRADRRATGRGGKARLPGGAALKSAMLSEEVTAAAEERGITPWLRCRCAALEADERCPSYVRQMERSSSPRPRGDCAAARGSFEICDARDARARRAREREREEERGERQRSTPLFHCQTADDVFVTFGILKLIQNTPHGLQVRVLRHGKVRAPHRSRPAPPPMRCWKCELRRVRDASCELAALLRSRAAQFSM